MQRFLVADLEVEVDGLVRERREFVAEAELVLAGHVRRPREAVVLLARVLVQHLAVDTDDLDVNVVVAPGDDLTANTKRHGEIINLYSKNPN